MAEFCKHLIAQDRAAYRLCEKLAEGGEGLTSLDRGIPRLDLTNEKKPKPVLSGDRDGIVSASEIRRRFLELTESDRTFPSRLAPIFQEIDKTQVPWIFKGEALYRFCLNQIRDLKRVITHRGFQEGSADYNRQLARELFHFLERPKSAGGLGVRYVEESSRVAQDLEGIYRSGKANCLEFVFFYLALSRLAGLSSTPFEMFRDRKGNLVEHVRIGVRFDPQDSQKIIYLDLSNHLEDEKPGDLQGEISSSELMADYYNTLGAAAPMGRMGFYFQKALSFSPDQYMVLSNYGNWILETGGSTEVAINVLLRAAATNPQFPFIWLGLEKAYQLLGDEKMATLAKKKADRLFQSRKPGQ